MIRHSGDDYAEAFAALLPTGPAWPREIDSDLMRFVYGIAQIWRLVDGRAADLAEIETDPRLTYELLAEWERAFGLPEPIALFDQIEEFRPFSFGLSSFGGDRGRIEPPLLRRRTEFDHFESGTAQSLPERRSALVEKITVEGGQSRAFFLSAAQKLGYEITISEPRPFQFGLSSFGGRRGQLQGPLARFYWIVSVHGARVTRFQFGASSFGMDPILRLGRAEDLESVFRRRGPAHAMVIFNYDDRSPLRAIRFEFGESRFGNDPILDFAA